MPSMKTNKQLALEVNKKLKSKKISVSRFAIFDGDQQVAPDCYCTQTAWSKARTAVCCPFGIGSKVLDKNTGEIYTVRGSTFGYPHLYEDSKGLVIGSVSRLFEYTDSDRFEVKA